MYTGDEYLDAKYNYYPQVLTGEQLLRAVKTRFPKLPNSENMNRYELFKFYMEHIFPRPQRRGVIPEGVDQRHRIKPKKERDTWSVPSDRPDPRLKKLGIHFFYEDEVEDEVDKRIRIKAALIAQARGKPFEDIEPLIESLKSREASRHSVSSSGQVFGQSTSAFAPNFGPSTSTSVPNFGPSTSTFGQNFGPSTSTSVQHFGPSTSTFGQDYGQSTSPFGQDYGQSTSPFAQDYGQSTSPFGQDYGVSTPVYDLDYEQSTPLYEQDLELSTPSSDEDPGPSTSTSDEEFAPPKYNYQAEFAPSTATSASDEEPGPSGSGERVTLKRGSWNDEEPDPELEPPPKKRAEISWP